MKFSNKALLELLDPILRPIQTVREKALAISDILANGDTQKYGQNWFILLVLFLILIN
jgi:hypothetical protein